MHVCCGGHSHACRTAQVKCTHKQHIITYGVRATKRVVIDIGCWVYNTPCASERTHDDDDDYDDKIIGWPSVRVCVCEWCMSRTAQQIVFVCGNIYHTTYRRHTHIFASFAHSHTYIAPCKKMTEDFRIGICRLLKTVCRSSSRRWAGGQRVHRASTHPPLHISDWHLHGGLAPNTARCLRAI